VSETSEPLIREAAPAEAAAVAALLEACGLDPAGVLTAGSRYWVAEDESGLVGVVGLEIGAGAALLRSAGVRPDRQRRGVGARLFARAYGAARALGIPTVYCFSTGAGEYWAAQGFREVPVDEVVAALPAAFQVQHYRELGWLPTEVAWRRDLGAPAGERAERQIAFIVEADRLKQVIRRTKIMDGQRHENSAEHSWHLALMALVLAEHAPGPLDLGRAVRMLLVHDLVEIDAGDTFAFDALGNQSKAAREQAAADRLFALPPEDQGAELRALWDEFEAGETPEARFAVALDRLEPLICNMRNGGGTWREHGIARAAVLRRMDPIRTGAPALWPYVLAAVEAAVAAGWVAE
jgi:putative hydrolase of HD superfamily